MGKEALKCFIQNIYWGEDLALETAKRNLEEGLVEIVHWGCHAANGPPVTKSGFFVTNHHCLLSGMRGIKIRTSNGKSFRVDSICLSDKEKDIVLARAEIPGPEEPMKYKYFDVREFSSFPFKRTPVVLMTRWGGKTIIAGGYTNGRYIPRSRVVDDNTLCKDRLLLEVASKRGDSGGAVVSVRGQLIGIFSHRSVSGRYKGFCTAWYDVLKLVSLFSSR